MSSRKEPGPSPWWDRDRHADRRPFLLARGRIKAALRRWFEGQDFVEVDTAVLQKSPGNEVHLHAFETSLTASDGSRSPLYLHTSPEFACKKLLAAGETRLFTFAPVFRNRECGQRHHPEFTMLEWYRAHESYETLMSDCAEILKLAADAAQASHFVHRDARIDATLAPERISVAEAFAAMAGIDLLAAADDRDALAAAARSAGIRVADDDTWGDVFSRVIVERIEPRLGQARPTILDAYPVREAALARPKPEDPRVAERFELYVGGVELANAFGELTDPTEQRSRFEAAMSEKARIYGEHYPIDEDFLAALGQMPPASGIALGFDRLVMLATGANDIKQVIWTPLPQDGSVNT